MPEAPESDRFIDLLRHGEAEGGFRLRGRTDDPLTDKGFAQMREAIGAERPWQRIVTSDLRRCAAFAEALGAEAGIPVESEPRLRELDFGDWEGRLVEAVWEEDEARAAAFWERPFVVAPPGGEAPEAMKRRVLAAWEALSSGMGAREHWLLVTHGGPIRVILGKILQMPDDALVRIEVPHASLTRIRIPAGDWAPSLMRHGPASAGP